LAHAIGVGCRSRPSICPENSTNRPSHPSAPPRLRLSPHPLFPGSPFAGR
jgi:hypothetical protein